MYELIHAAGNTYYIDCPAKIGVYLLEDGSVYLIDSGNDKAAGKKILKILNEKGWSLRAVVNTHSHADHIGGNRILQERTGCAVYAAGTEAAFIRRPELESAFLYGGRPNKLLRNKFLFAEPSAVSTAFPSDMFPSDVPFTILPLPGHYFDMIGLRTPDDVWFLADCLSSESVLQKYHVAFLYDVGAYLDTLDTIEALEGKLFIPAHAEASSDIHSLAACNRRKTHEIADTLTALCSDAKSFDTLLKGLFDAYQLQMDMNQYVLVGSTVRSYLSWLMEMGRMELFFENNQLFYHSVDADHSAAEKQ